MARKMKIEIDDCEYLTLNLKVRKLHIQPNKK